MLSLSFEWDEAKANANLGKHGVAFEEAASVFLDERGLVINDPDHSVSEDRFVLLGMSSHWRLVIVCFCLRLGTDAIRIISARSANRRERAHYRTG